jgi:UDP-N-acetylglucosamine 4-epimerase
MDFNSKVLVGGGAGFVGTNLTDRLRKEGASMTIFDDFLVGFKRNLHEIVEDVTMVRGDVRDFVMTKGIIFVHALCTDEICVGGVGRPSADVTRMRELGFRPKVDVRTGLARFMGWFKSLCQERRDVRCE